MSKRELLALLEAGDIAGLHERARTDGAWRVLRVAQGRLYSADPAEKARALRAIGAIVGDQGLMSHEQVVELLRRFLWLMNDESGAVPFGVPEAVGEVLVVRPELQATYLPILGSFLTGDEMFQTGAIERSVMNGLARVGPAAAELAPHAIDALRDAAAGHHDPTTRATAVEALRVLGETSEMG